MLLYSAKAFTCPSSVPAKSKRRRGSKERELIMTLFFPTTEEFDIAPMVAFVVAKWSTSCKVDTATVLRPPATTAGALSQLCIKTVLCVIPSGR